MTHPTVENPMPRFLLPLCLLCLPLLTGCGEKSAVLAQVGDRTITDADFRDVARGHESNYPTPPDSAKRMVLDDMMRRELLVVEALRRHLDQESLAVRYRRDVEDGLLVDALYRRAAPNDIPVSDGEVNQFFAWRDSTAHCLIIYTPEKADAEHALAQLQQGEDFGAVADRFNTVGTVPPGGDIGFRLSGDLVDPLDEQLRNAPVGKLIGPLQAPTEGWFIMKVVERRSSDQPPLEEQREKLKVMLRQRKQRAAANAMYLSLRDKYGVQIAPGGPQAMFSYYNDVLRRESTGDPTQPGPTPELQAQVLARYHDAEGKSLVYTFGDAHLELQDARRNRPDVTMVPAIRRWIESQVVRRAAIMEARRERLDHEPDIARRIDREVTSYLADAIFSSEVTDKVNVTDSDLRAAYEKRREFIQNPFEKITPAERSALHSEAVNAKSEVRFTEYTDELKKTIQPYRAYEDRLARIQWPIPETNTGSS